MKRMSEDLLIQLAYGELSPSEAEQVKSQIAGDAKLTAQLKRYQDLAGGLNLLKDIPEEQLSTERLRDAILGSGLKPARTGGLSWLWMPTTGFTLAFGFMMLRGSAGNSNIPSQLAMNSHSPAQSRDLTPESSAIVSNASSSNVAYNDNSSQDDDLIDMVTQADAAPQAVSTSSVKRHRSVRHQVAPRENSIGENPFMILTGAGKPSDKTIPKAEIVNAGMESSNLVLIGSEPDAELGASKAREVDTATNVVIGG